MKKKIGKLRNTPYRTRASDGLRRRTANISKEATANCPGPCCWMERCYLAGNRIDVGRSTHRNSKFGKPRQRVS